MNTIKKKIKINDLMLSTTVWMVNKPIATVIVVHGYGEHEGYYINFAEYLNSCNIRVITYDQRGFGNSEGQRGYTTNARLFVSDLIEIYNYVHIDCSHPLFIVSFSMGTIFTLDALIQKKITIKGVVFIGTPLDVDNSISKISFSLMKLMSIIIPKVKLIPGIIPQNYSTDKEIVKSYITDKLTLKGKWYLKFGVELLKLNKSIKKSLNKIEIPALVLYGDEDIEVPQSGSKNLYNSISSLDKEIVPFQNMYHSLITDRKKEIVFRTISKWIENKI